MIVLYSNQNSIIIILRKYFSAIMTRQKFISFESLIIKKKLSFLYFLPIELPKLKLRNQIL